ncbi:hypothetical protein [Streptomyces sp. Midd1]|uniref:hypothetical protein n=1 Tax=Streptomyces sp. Midd3 TaxID=3161191 RepID=UPI0034DB43F5
MAEKKKKKTDTVTLPGTGIYENTFDKRIQSIPSYLPSESGGSSYGLIRGYMVTAFPKGKSGRFYMLNFLYNPSTIQVSHSLDAANQVMPAYTRSDQDTGTPLTAAGGTLSYSLLFDRSYEMSDPGQFNTVEGTYGVMADIHVLYNLVGINTKQQVWSSATSSDAASTETGDVVGIMQMNPVWVHFNQARTRMADKLPSMSRMSYFGYLNSLDISYTHFTQRMTPVRCAVSISMQLMSTVGWV